MALILRLVLILHYIPAAMNVRCTCIHNSSICEQVLTHIQALNGWIVARGAQLNPPLFCPQHRKVIEAVNEIEELMIERLTKMKEQGEKRTTPRRREIQPTEKCDQYVQAHVNRGLGVEAEVVQQHVQDPPEVCDGKPTITLLERPPLAYPESETPEKIVKKSHKTKKASARNPDGPSTEDTQCLRINRSRLHRNLPCARSRLAVIETRTKGNYPGRCNYHSVSYRHFYMLETQGVATTKSMNTLPSQGKL